MAMRALVWIKLFLSVLPRANLVSSEEALWFNRLGKLVDVFDIPNALERESQLSAEELATSTLELRQRQIQMKLVIER
jgi:hypothetical protein